METHPPKLIEYLIGGLIPPACREHVLGDLCERYSSPAQYIQDAAATLPFIVASQIRRTFRIQLFLAEACALYLAFGGSSLAAGPAYLYDHAAFRALAIVIGVVLLVLILCDAYADPRDQSSQTPRLQVGLALTFAYFSQGLLGSINPAWILPIWIMLTGSAISFPMLLMLRSFFRPPQRDTAIAGGGATSIDEIRRRSTEEFQKAWRVNWSWLIAAIVVMFTTPKVRPAQPGWWELGSGVFLVVLIVLTGWRSKNGRIGTEERYLSLSITRDPYRNKLERKRDGLMYWAGGGLFSLLPGAGPSLFLFLIAVPLLMFFVRWLVDARYPSNVSPMHVWLSSVAFVILLVAWAFVRAINLRAARAMRRELEALDSERKQ